MKILNFKSKLALLVSVLMFTGLVSVGVSRADDFTLTLSTINPTSSVADYGAGTFPTVSDKMWLRFITIAQSSTTVQTITIYDTCSSSSAATVAYTAYIPATIGNYSIPKDGLFPARLFNLEDMCITKSVAGNAAAQANIFYQ